MRILTCITTRNRTETLNACLRAVWDSNVKPHIVVVSDDSPDAEVQEKNRQVAEQYPGTTYVLGPRTGVCANRNNAVNTIPASEADLVAFIDDDICVEPDFIACAIDRYTQMPLEQRNCTILSGVSQHEHEKLPSKLSFQGYFHTTDIPEAVVIHAAVFPRLLFEKEQWDENIFFGYEDAELCLRALKRGYRILHCPELKVFEMNNQSTLEMHSQNTPAITSTGSLTNYEIYIEAARLYIGIKRYKDLFPNPFKLFVFITIYFVHMTIYLVKRGSLKALPEIVRHSHIQRLWSQSALKST